MHNKHLIDLQNSSLYSNQLIEFDSQLYVCIYMYIPLYHTRIQAMWRMDGQQYVRQIYLDSLEMICLVFNEVKFHKYQLKNLSNLLHQYAELFSYEDNIESKYGYGRPALVQRKKLKSFDNFIVHNEKSIIEQDASYLRCTDC